MPAAPNHVLINNPQFLDALQPSETTRAVADAGTVYGQQSGYCAADTPDGDVVRGASERRRVHVDRAARSWVKPGSLPGVWREIREITSSCVTMMDDELKSSTTQRQNSSHQRVTACV